MLRSNDNNPCVVQLLFHRLSGSVYYITSTPCLTVYSTRRIYRCGSGHPIITSSKLRHRKQEKQLESKQQRLQSLRDMS
jgi:hypothetical protein